jgi:hypothetical protein
MEYVIPFGAALVRLGSANVLTPLPPYVVPRSENRAVFCCIERICPVAGTPIATDPAVNMICPR